MQIQLTIDFGITSLAGTLAYQLFDAQNNPLTALTTAGVVEYPVASGNYYATITWDPTWPGVKVVWSDGIRKPTSDWIDSPIHLFAGANAVTLRFKDVHGNPVPSVTFNIVGLASTTTDVSGIITINLASGTYVVRTLAASGNIWSDATINVSGSQTFDIVANTQVVVLTPNLCLSDVASADNYFNSRLFATQWLALDSNTKQLALNDATRRIDLLAYKGIRTDSAQLHEFPRTGLLLQGASVDPTLIPNEILAAQYEIAFALIKGFDPERDMRSSFVSSRAYSSVRIAYDSKQIPDYIRFGIPSLIAWQNLLVYLDTEFTGTLTRHRVS